MIQKIGLTGIPYTSLFPINVAQRGQSASGETYNWGGSENPWGEQTPGVSATIRLVKRSNLQIAPEGMIFEVDLAGFDTPGPIDPNAYDPQFHNLYYFWDFGDPGSRFTAPENVMEHQRDANRGYGPVVSHVYDTPGEKTVQVMVVEPTSGKVAQAVFAIGGKVEDTPEIKSPATLFPTNRTFIVDNTRYGSAAYPGAVIYPTINAAVSALAGKTEPHRIVVRDGQTFTTTNNLGFGASVPSCHIVREGGGIRPKIYAGHGARMFQFSTFDANNTKDFVINGIELEGPWDGTDESGIATRSCFEASTDQGDYFMVHNCNMDKFAHAYVALQYTNETGVRLFSNSSVVGCRSYPFYEEINAPCAYLGMRVQNDVNALSGGPRNGLHNDAAIIRFQSCTKVVMDGCDLFSRCGWFENIVGIRTAQPCVRWNQRSGRGAKGNIQRCSMEGGNVLISVDRMSNTVATNVQNVLIERNILVGSDHTKKHIVIAHGGSTVRNNHMTHRNLPRIPFYGLFEPSAFVETVLYTDAGAQKGNVAESGAAPILIIYNTCVSMMDASNGNPADKVVAINATGGTYTALTEKNNILIAPGAAIPQMADGPFAATSLWKPRYKGYRSAYERMPIILPVPVPNGSTITMQYMAGRSAADYPVTPTEPHKINIGDDLVPKTYINVDVTFGASTIIVTNNSDSVWAAGKACLVFFCPDSPANLGPFATPTDDITLYHPASGSSALGTADEDFCVVGDFFGNFRSAYPSRGALEIAP